ncbi:MAG: MFS transporter [Euryarchaeota archaeon]|nr:MFS transporter [Euryarchaeota archaeon]
MEQKLYRYRWVIVGIFWLVIFAYGANWFALSPMLGEFKTTFGITNTWQTPLLISLIGMFVIFFAWPAGSLTDRKGPKLSISIGALFMAIWFGIRPWLLDSLYTLLGSSIIAGIGLAWILVAMAPQMLRWFPHKQASLAVGIAASGLFIGFGTGSLCMPLLVSMTSKFNSFLLFGIIAIIACIIWIIFARDSPKTPPEEQKKVQVMGFAEGMKNVLHSKNAFLYPIVGFLIVGITLVISHFIPTLYSFDPNMKKQGGYIAGFLLYGCALGAFTAPFAAKKFGIRKITLSVIGGAIILWLVLFVLFYTNSYDVTALNWILIVFIAFLFGVCFQASWPLALYSQETEEGVSEANVGIAASLYISISNIGAAVLPVIFPILFPDNFTHFIAITIGLLICLLIWGIVKRK